MEFQAVTTANVVSISVGLDVTNYSHAINRYCLLPIEERHVFRRHATNHPFRIVSGKVVTNVCSEIVANDCCAKQFHFDAIDFLDQRVDSPREGVLVGAATFCSIVRLCDSGPGRLELAKAVLIGKWCATAVAMAMVATINATDTLERIRDLFLMVSPYGTQGDETGPEM